jgi:hypothetical protein
VGRPFAERDGIEPIDDAGPGSDCAQVGVESDSADLAARDGPAGCVGEKPTEHERRLVAGLDERNDAEIDLGSEVRNQEVHAHAIDVDPAIERDAELLPDVGLPDARHRHLIGQNRESIRRRSKEHDKTEHGDSRSATREHHLPTSVQR